MGSWGVKKGVRDPSLEGVFGGSGPPRKWGARFGVFLGGKKWSTMVTKGAGRRGKHKCSFRGLGWIFPQEKRRCLGCGEPKNPEPPPPPGAAQNPPGGVSPPPPPPPRARGRRRIVRLSAPQAPTFCLRENPPLPPEPALLLTPPSRTFFDYFLPFFGVQKKCKSRPHFWGGSDPPPDPPQTPSRTHF
jgi:hypothetical protein